MFIVLIMIYGAVLSVHSVEMHAFKRRKNTKNYRDKS